MPTFEDLKAMINFHNEIKDVNDLVKSGKYEIDVWEEGSTSGSVGIKLMIRKTGGVSVETTTFPRRLKTLMCNSSHSDF